MTKALSTYSFLPWLRQGISNQIQAADNDSNTKLRAPINVNLRIVGKGIAENPINKDIVKPVGLYGPGDLDGVDSRNVIKTEPGNWITNFEPNYLAAIDFYDEDLPWRYTPAKPDSKDRLRPWITLVVLKEDEFKNGKDMTNRPLPYVELLKSTDNIFPPADQLWAWAHVHVNRDLIKNDIVTTSATGQPYIEKVKSDATTEIMDEFENTLKENPDLAYSRILCPRRLEEKTPYHAFLIPTFESGRLAALGQDVEAEFNKPGSPLYATWSAWKTYNNRLDANLYPYFHRWYFRTGTMGDFEYLVRLLEPKPMNSRVGRRDMDVTKPGADIDGIGDDPENGLQVPQLKGMLRLGGALRVPVDSLKEEEKEIVKKYDEWAKPYPRDFQKQLAAFINLADTYSKNTARDAHKNPDLPEKIRVDNFLQDEPDPLITAPLYGTWHALTKRLLEVGDGFPDDNWIHELNLDPRFRVAAGFGTGIIQKNQEKYMESAWKQVGKVIEANQRLRWMQLSHTVAKYLYSFHIKPMYKNNQGAFLWLTQPVQARVLSKGLTLNQEEELLTVQHHVKTSKVPAAAFSANTRKLIRPNGRLQKSLNFDPTTNPETSLLEQINKDLALPAPVKKVPSEIMTTQDIVQAVKPKLPQFLLNWIEKYPWLKYLLMGIALILLILLGLFAGPNLFSLTPISVILTSTGIITALLLTYVSIRSFSWEKQIRHADTMKEENQTPDAVDNLPKSADFHLTIPGQGISFVHGESDSDEAERFKSALRDVGELMQANMKAADKPSPPRLLLEDISTAMLQTLDPEISMPKKMVATIAIPERIRKDFVYETIKEAMAYPEIDTPMYKPLIDISADLFLPNINLIGQNTISLLETNQKFIESYMVGLNHEFARELLWREYPTDQRGSYFRQFWDTSGFLFDPDQIKTFINEIKQEFNTSDGKIILEKLRDKIKEKLKDIPPIHKWSKFSALGDHDNREKPGDKEQEAVLVIRGELLKKYPNAVIYAHRAKWKPKEGSTTEPDRKQERELVPLPSGSEENPPRDTVKTPLYEAKVDPDIYFFGFDLTIVEAQGMTEGEPADLEDRAGWFFVLKERPGEPRFGLDIGTTAPGELEVWNDLSWENITPPVPEGGFIQLTAATQTIDVGMNTLESDDDEKLPQREEDIQITWNKDMNSAELAYILFQAPVMVAVHGAEMLPK
jgi:hypothetical protein